jgi:hypothetical protein
MCYLGRGENEREITIFCRLLKDHLKEDPKTITVDYKPAWDRWINRVFPRTLIIRDGFHTVQLINRAIFKDFFALVKKLFTTPIMETKRLYQAIRREGWQGNAISLVPTHDHVKEFKWFHALLVQLYTIEELPEFIRELDAILHLLSQLSTPHAHALATELRTRLPPNGLTEKNVKYYKLKLKGALSSVMREFRRQIESEKREVMPMRYVLLKREEKLSSSESESLDQFLTKFPQFKKYRELSLRISDIYHVPPTTLTDSIITGISLWADAGAALRAAVKTLKKNVREILNFQHLFPKGTPMALYKKVRTSPEPVMRKVKDVVRTRFGLRTATMSQLYLEQQLKCPVVIAPGQKVQIIA